MTDWVQRPQETQRLWEMPIAGLQIDLENQEFSSTGTQGSLHKHFWIEHPLKKPFYFSSKYTAWCSQGKTVRLTNLESLTFSTWEWDKETHTYIHIQHRVVTEMLIQRLAIYTRMTSLSYRLLWLQYCVKVCNIFSETRWRAADFLCHSVSKASIISLVSLSGCLCTNKHS